RRPPAPGARPGSPSRASRARRRRGNRRRARTRRRCAWGSDRPRPRHTPSGPRAWSGPARGAAAPAPRRRSWDRGRESRPPRDERVAREEDRLAGLVHRLGLEHREVEDAVRALLLVDVGDAAGEREGLAGLHGTRVLELLLAVDEGHE